LAERRNRTPMLAQNLSSRLSTLAKSYFLF
jgi:hypothetical protein